MLALQREELVLSVRIFNPKKMASAGMQHPSCGLPYLDIFNWGGGEEAGLIAPFTAEVWAAMQRPLPIPSPIDISHNGN